MPTLADVLSQRLKHIYLYLISHFSNLFSGFLAFVSVITNKNLYLKRGFAEKLLTFKLKQPSTSLIFTCECSLIMPWLVNISRLTPINHVYRNLLQTIVAGNHFFQVPVVELSLGNCKDGLSLAR